MRLLPTATHLIGVLPPSPSCPSTLSLLKSLPFSFIFLDLEHTPHYPLHKLPDTLNHIGLTPSLVRIPGKNSLDNIQKVLDSGAQNLLIPMINNEEEAAAVVSAAKFPPLGNRGCAASFWNDFGTSPTPFATSEANDQVSVGVQIETIEGVKNARAIAATPGVDWVFLGPVDLASSLGAIESEEFFRHEDVQRVLKDVGEIILSEGKEVGTLITNKEDTQTFSSFKVNVALGSSMLLDGSKQFLNDLA